MRYIGFQNLLYRKFISPREHDAKKVAAAIGESLSTLYNYVEGISYCPVDLVARLYKATGDKDFLNFVLDDTDQKLAPREPSKDKKTLEGELLDVAAANGNLMQAAHKALKDGGMSKSEGRDLLRKIGHERKELDDLHVLLLERTK